MPNYATADEVKNKDLSRQTLQAGWDDGDIDERIDRAEAQLEACLVSLGYDLVALRASDPPVVKQWTIIWSRGIIFQDLFTSFAPSRTSADGFQPYLDQVMSQLEKLKAGDLDIFSSAGALIEPVRVPDSQRIQVNTDETRRALTMKDPEDEFLNSRLYSNERVTGDPEDPNTVC